MAVPPSQPSSAITGFHQDADGVWVAELACGHPQHVRHKPPFQLAPWVLTPEGRAGKLGTSLPCPLCRMPRLPVDAVEYKRTAELDETTVPAGLLQRHALKTGTWGQIVVLEGRLLYVLEDEDDLAFTLRPEVPGVVAPERPHHVTPQGRVRFFVRFLRTP